MSGGGLFVVHKRIKVCFQTDCFYIDVNKIDVRKDFGAVKRGTRDV